MICLNGQLNHSFNFVFMRLIAFYLPQYHCFPENDEWWGTGFTEWTNVKKAKQFFKWQYQPRVPYNDRYYNLESEFQKTMSWQISIAKKYGVYGFCFYHYWFKNGKKLMEKPIESFLNNKELNIPFCISWANEPWTRAWDGGSSNIIMPQEYGDKTEWGKHFEYLLSFFEDKRYIKEDGKPMLIIYRMEIIPQLDDMLSYWNELAIKSGFNGLHIVSQGSAYGNFLVKSSLVNSFILYEPGYTQAEFSFDRTEGAFKNHLKSPRLGLSLLFQKIKTNFAKLLKIDNVRMNTTILNYDLFWKHILKRKYTSLMYPGAFVDWDNTPRRGAKGGRVFKGSNPRKFAKYMQLLIQKVKQEASSDFLFIDAWNEWAEGTYLEPDKKNEYGYLEALKQALNYLA